MSGRSREERASMRRHPAGSGLTPRLRLVSGSTLFSGLLWVWLTEHAAMPDQDLAEACAARFHWSQDYARECVRAYREVSK